MKYAQCAGVEFLFLPKKAKQSIVCHGETPKLDKWVINEVLFPPQFILNAEFHKAIEHNKKVDF